MLAGRRHPKLLAPRGRGFTRLENQVFVHSVRSGVEEAENDLGERAARFAERSVGVITAGGPNAGATGHRVRPSIPKEAVQHRCNRPTAPRTPAAKSRTSVRARERCAPGRGVADRDLPPEAEWASFTRMENEE
ncbi:hypothetical protein [Bradyrhizobium elkanii]|uniref:hypothetical protein n=1 Tax=Bradyrhizobium elkanii TaxID=29448 RepID=UPI00209D9E9C|nr:hypothetical protein [Bradyrhizobium elkanii]MCP1967994.1 hypothetical protein [Bradyrhizobium elkanii]MCS3524288.1 hypothetical protein [Bradyrhizobium elkanii]MCS4071944.1 hypothetical protein [Bradyrhizobium elkanii]MCS4078577.1 hypothetical protein [Bradyrhizobium elkanii]MCS4110504.1 hypothetical protein [Bradyrhizobium elkanii]